MADLDVKTKNNTQPMMTWILVALGLMLVLMFAVKGCGRPQDAGGFYGTNDSTTGPTTTGSGTGGQRTSADTAAAVANPGGHTADTGAAVAGPRAHTADTGAAK